MWKLHIKLADGKIIEGHYSSMFYAHDAADNYDKLSKKCGLTLIDSIVIREIRKDA